MTNRGDHWQTGDTWQRLYLYYEEEEGYTVKIA